MKISLKSRGIQIQESDAKFMNLLENPVNPLSKCVQVAEDGASLKWPCVLLYPEFGQTEFIEAFDEYSTYKSKNNFNYLKFTDFKFYFKI